MAFIPLQEVLQKKSETHPALQQAGVLREIQARWEKAGIALFPRGTRRHLRRVRAISLRKGVLVLAVPDASTATLLFTQQHVLIKIFQPNNGSVLLRDIQIRIRSLNE